MANVRKKKVLCLCVGVCAGVHAHVSELACYRAIDVPSFTANPRKREHAFPEMMEEDSCHFFRHGYIWVGKQSLTEIVKMQFKHYS